MTLLPNLYFVTRIFVNETRSANGLNRLLLILEMPLKIEFVFLTEDCQVLKLNLFDPRWQMNEGMNINDDDKTSLMIDGSEVDCVLLKHGPPGAMDVEFRKIKKLMVRLRTSVLVIRTLPHVRERAELAIFDTNSEFWT